MPTQRVLIGTVVPNIEGRPLEQAEVERIAASMEKIGLLHPLSVVPLQVYYKGQADYPGFLVVAGNHRLAAAKQLGWEEIDVHVVGIEPRDIPARRLVEISENLHRAELSALERSRLMKEWVELTKGKVGQIAPPCGGEQPAEQGLRKTAKELGATREDVRRSLRIASLSPEAQAVAREEGLDDNKSALLEAAKEKEPARQVAVLKGRAVTQRQERTPADLIWDILRKYPWEEAQRWLSVVNERLRATHPH